MRLRRVKDGICSALIETPKIDTTVSENRYTLHFYFISESQEILPYVLKSGRGASSLNHLCLTQRRKPKGLANAIDISLLLQQLLGPQGHRHRRQIRRQPESTLYSELHSLPPFHKFGEAWSREFGVSMY